MPCNKLMKEAYDSIGINFTYKLDDTLNKLDDRAKMTPTQMMNYLRNKGVSPKEISQSGIDNMYKGEYPFTVKEWKEDFARLGNKHHISKVDSTEYGIDQGYSDVTLGNRGYNNPTYKEELYRIKRPKNAPAYVRHYEDFDTGTHSIVGWNRTHIDPDFDGKPATVLNEYQSDWAQSKDDLFANFPLSRKSWDKFNIVSSIDEAIKNGTNRVIIPIERENELVGRRGVTDSYASLNLTSLPKDFRNELELNRKADMGDKYKPLSNKNILTQLQKEFKRKGLELDISVKPYNNKLSGKEIFNNASERGDYDLLDESLDDLESLTGNSKVIEDIYEAMREYSYNGYDTIVNIIKENNIDPKIWDSILDNNFPSGGSNMVHVIDIKKIPNHKVDYSIYSILGALGLSELADKLKEDKKQ